MLTTSPGSHSTDASKGRQQTSQSVVNRCEAMLVSTTISKLWPQNGQEIFSETSITYICHFHSAQFALPSTEYARLFLLAAPNSLASTLSETLSQTSSIFIPVFLLHRTLIARSQPRPNHPRSNRCQSRPFR